MISISDNIYDYYIEHFYELPVNKQLHFASRLFLWSQDSKAENLLSELQTEITSDGNILATLKDIIDEHAQETTGEGSLSILRQKYYDNYPLLNTYVAVLFRILMLKTVYRMDAKRYFYELFDKDKVEEFNTQLLNDHQAIRVLSTHAVNFLYIYQLLIKEKNSDQLADSIFSIGSSGYDLNDLSNIKLLIYLYTHSIIGESQFYFRKVNNNKAIYINMITFLEDLIDNNYVSISLDNKFEFLVCTKILEYSTRVKDRIMEEARQSIPNNNYITDLLNKNKRPDGKNNIVNAEHRNVLYIMSNQEFTPLT